VEVVTGEIVDDVALLVEDNQIEDDETDVARDGIGRSGRRGGIRGGWLCGLRRLTLDGRGRLLLCLRRGSGLLCADGAEKKNQGQSEQWREEGEAGTHQSRVLGKLLSREAAKKDGVERIEVSADRKKSPDICPGSVFE